MSDNKHWLEPMQFVIEYARKSPDPSTQNGGMLCDSSGVAYYSTVAVNEFPYGVQYTPERWERPLKYSVIEHAERNSIYKAAQYGVMTSGLTLVCGWAACADCARAIIQARLERLVTLAPREEDTNGRWGDSIDIAMVMLQEAGVEVVYLDHQFGITLRRNGKEFVA